MKRASASFIGYLGICGLVLLIGCEKKVVTTKTVDNPSVETPKSPSAPTLTPQRVQPVSVPASASDSTAVLDALTQALRKYAVEHHRMPNSFSEVLAAGYVKDMPNPPAGKRFEVDRKTSRVVLLPQ